MLKYVMLLFFTYTKANLDDSFENLLKNTRRNGVDEQDSNYLESSYFMPLNNYEMQSNRVHEAVYPWIARVVHSRNAEVPHACTAVCIDERIFITAANCIYSRVVTYTTVIYLKSRLRAVAFVLPSTTTKQLHDDIGFIVVDQTDYKGAWMVVDLFDRSNRTDNTFLWFSNLQSTFSNVKVVGYATAKGLHKVVSMYRQYYLTELNVVVGLDICPKILASPRQINVFKVPCYHSCDVREFFNRDVKCRSYHGVEGGAVLDKKTNTLIGIATWGVYFREYELPVGFSVPNSVNFFKDYKCAKRISSVDHRLVKPGFYQSLCMV